MYDSRSDELGAHSAEKYYRYEGQQYEPYTTIMGQSGLPLSIPYGLFQYAKYQEDPRNAKVKDTLRRGKWTDEEVKLTDRIIETFNAGSLELDPETAGGVTLRSYLSEKLGCDPMRITKKYTGASCLGKRVYHSANTKAPREVVEAVKIELAYLEEKFRDKLEKNCRDRLGLEADVDKHLRNQVVSTPSIDAMMMQGGTSGPRKGGANVSMPPTMMIHGSDKTGYWTKSESPLVPLHTHASSSSTSKSSTTGALSMNLLSSRDQDNHNFEYGMKVISSSEYSSEKYSLKNPSEELTTFQSMISSTETAIGCEKPVETITIKSEKNIYNDNAHGSYNQELHIPSSRPISKAKKVCRRIVPNFPYSRYHDPISPVSASSKGGFELSASSYYYAPSAQEVEASKVQQQKQQQHQVLILQQQQQHQNQQYYLSLQKSSDRPSVPNKTNLTTHCVPTLANIGGVKRKDSNEEQNILLTESKTKQHKLESVKMRNRNDLPIEAFLKSGNIHCGTAGYQSIKGHGQGLLITVPIVSDSSTNGQSNDDSSGGGSPDAAGSEEIGSGCNASGTNSDEGDTSDDQTDYKKISCHGYSNKNIYSGSTYEYKTFPANSSSNCKSMIQVLCPDSFLPDTTSINSSSGYAIQEKQQHPLKSDLQKVSFPPHTNTIEFNVTGDSKDLSEKDKSFLIPTAHDEALLSMMSFFSHCHQVESAKII